MARAQGARAQMALGFESTYGTPPAANSFWRMPFAPGTNLGAAQPLLNSELLGYGRDPLPPVKDAITVDGDVVIPLDARYLGIWLKLLFGAPTTTGTGGPPAEAPFTHEFRSGGWSLPSAAIEIGLPEVPHFAMISGAKANSISWSMRRSGLVTATVAVIGQGEAVNSATQAGTLEELALTRFGAFQGQIARNGTPLANIVSGQVTYSNNLDRVETIRDDGKIDGADPSMASLTGQIVARFADQVLMGQATNGQACALRFEYEIDTDTSFVLEAHDVYLPKPKVPLEGPGGVQVTFDWQAALDSGVGRMCTATLKNDMANFDNPT